MKRLVVLQIALAGCSSQATPDKTSQQRAVLQVTFGSTTDVLEADVVSSSTSSRFMMQASDSEITVFVSLPIPVHEGQITLTNDAEAASVWAKQGSSPPLIATTGGLTIDKLESALSFVFEDVSKPMDSGGTSLLISGSMTGIKAP